MTDLDSPRRNNDCYFYYYSTCAKGDSCTFRHEPSALGCETMCSFWKEGKCLNVHCNFRHMELRKNRKAIQCYWETQPGGCLKPHCPFLHQNVKQSLSDYADNNIGSKSETTQTGKQNDIGQTADKFKNPVDSLVVNFEEESDTESAPSFSPAKPQIKKVKVKTLEEIKLERIQEEAAAYFSYHEKHSMNMESEDDLRHRLLKRMTQKRSSTDDQQEIPKIKKIRYAENTSLDDHINILVKKGKSNIIQKDAEEISLEEHILQKRKEKFMSLHKKEEKEVSEIKIKTLAEIRAERLKRKHVEPDSQCNKTSVKMACPLEPEDEVSSTSKDETELKQTEKEMPKKRLKLKRLSSIDMDDFNEDCSNKTKDNLVIEEKHSGSNIPNVESNVEFPKDTIVEKLCTKQSRIEETEIDDNQTKTVVSNVNTLHEEETIKSDLQLDKDIQNFETEITETLNSVESNRSPSKLTEEALLLDDDEDFENVTLKAEDELLDEIDNILEN